MGKVFMMFLKNPKQFINGLKIKIGLGIIGSIFSSLPFFIVLVCVLALFIDIESDASIGVSSSSTCLPTISSICDSITVDGVTLDIDDYVAGVVNAEVGGMIDPNFNTYKAASVAARSYALVRSTKSNGNCLVTNSTAFQTYKSNPSTDIINAVNDTSGVVLVKDGSVYGSEYDALCINSTDANNYYLCQGGTSEVNLTVPASWLESKRSQNYIDVTSKQTHGRGMSQNGAWYLALEKGYSYEDILNYFYGDEGASLASINGSFCGNVNFTDLGTYNLKHNGLNVLNRVLNVDEINNLNSYIDSEINKAGDGTASGVAAAGQALVYGLEQMGYYLQYYWGGAHSGFGDKNGSFVGVNQNWGSTSFGSSQTGDGSYLGMDCSGFVSWAIRNGCNNSANNTAKGWMGISNTHKDLNKAKPGDIIVSSTHVQLVVKNNGDGTVIVAEETSGSNGGLIFDKVTSSNLGKNYVGDMSNYYQNNCKAS